MPVELTRVSQLAIRAILLVTQSLYDKNTYLRSLTLTFQEYKPSLLGKIFEQTYKRNIGKVDVSTYAARVSLKD